MVPALSVINHPCIVCYKPTSMWCSRCQHAYCTPEHLQSDWPRHRRECQCVPIASARSDTIATPPPAQPKFVTVSAILFAPHEDRPRMFTVTCERPRTPAQGSCPTPLVQGYFPGGQATSVVLTQGLNGEPLRFPLHLWYSPSALAANGSVNQAIFRITSGAASRPWCGPVIVLKYNGSSRQGYSDAGSDDLLALSAYSFPPFQYIDSKFPSLLQHLLAFRSFSDLPFRPLFCRFGCPSIEDAHHLFVHCPPFSSLRTEYETKLHSETARLLRESSLPAHILSHVTRAIATLFRDDASSWPFGSSRYYLGLLPPLTPTSVSLSSLSDESRRILRISPTAVTARPSTLRLASGVLSPASTLCHRLASRWRGCLSGFSFARDPV
ncbi:hypothetical protein BC826DRAFT_701323 [Russula brevipes]|nr:hypothetical protein BC826DRAFT_701323 [Russula brevipes]